MVRQAQFSVISRRVAATRQGGESKRCFSCLFVCFFVVFLAGFGGPPGGFGGFLLSSRSSGCATTFATNGKAAKTTTRTTKTSKNKTKTKQKHCFAYFSLFFPLLPPPRPLLKGLFNREFSINPKGNPPRTPFSFTRESNQPLRFFLGSELQFQTAAKGPFP